MLMNKAEEDYLKMIYELNTSQSAPYIKTSYLADKFGYTAQSVNEMVKRMAQKDLLVFEPYKGVKLTATGQKEALRMIRAHRLWEVFLHEKLELGWESLHEEAERLEHATSDEVLERLYVYLDKPAYCQHGNPIPDKHGHVAKETHQSLFDAQEKQYFTVKRVLDYKHLLEYLNTIDLSIGDKVYVEFTDRFGGIVHIQKDGIRIPVGKNVAEMIYGT